jgi:hypothetical protein
MSDNEKLEKAKQLIHDLADVVCYNKHWLNLMHKDNKNGFSQLFRGGEADIRSVAAHNRHEGKDVGRVQEGGTVMLLYGPLIEQYNMENSGRDETGLGRWVFMAFIGEGGIATRIMSCYNPCYITRIKSQELHIHINSRGDTSLTRSIRGHMPSEEILAGPLNDVERLERAR